MGNFRIVIDAVGGHGADRVAKDGEVVNFYKEGRNTPDALAKWLVDAFNWLNAGTVNSATFTHWPGEPGEVVDDLVSGKRSGNF